MPQGTARPNALIRKSCTSCGWTAGPHSRQAFLKSPTSSFSLLSTEITGSPAAVRPYVVVDVHELRIVVRMAVAFAGLAVGLQTKLLLMQLTDHRAPDLVAPVAGVSLLSGGGVGARPPPDGV